MAMKYNRYTDYYKHYCELIGESLSSVNQEDLNNARDIIFSTIFNYEPIYVCGNGGSAAIAEHLSCDFAKGVNQDTGLKTNVVSLSSNMALISAIANDTDYSNIFANQLEYLNNTRKNAANPKPLLLAISSSGNSPNIVKAIEYANANRINTLAFVGFDGGQAAKISKYKVHVNTNNYGVVEDCHQIVMHSIAQDFRIQWQRKDTVIKL